MKQTKETFSWDELREKEVGAILHDEFDEGLRFIVMRGPASLCAYIGLPQDHPLAGYNYELLPVDCHGGLTFASEGKDKWPEGFYWYGWDYSHAGDYAFYWDEPPLAGSFPHDDEHKWLLGEVISDSWTAKYDFKNLMKLVEQIADKAKS